MGIWTKDGKLIVDSNGKPIVCNNCPCGGVECRDAVDAEVASLLAEIDPETQAHVWALYGTFEPDYTCAQWHYDTENEEWVLDSMAQGKLAIALRYGTTVTDTTGGEAVLYTYAKVLYSVSQHLYKTIGCECHVSDHECAHRKTVKNDYCIAGELDVWHPDQSDSQAVYEPSKTCYVDPCKLLKLKMETAHYWHGGQLMGEGYYDWLLTPHIWEDYNYRYQPFMMALKWEVEMSYSDSESHEPIYNLTFIDCDCTSITTHTLQTGESCLEYAGICTLEDPCMPLMLLHNKAIENGWIWHGEGVLVHLAKITYSGTTYFGDWYAWRETSYWNGYDEYSAYSIFGGCAETPTSYIVVGCSCSEPYTYTKIYDDSKPESATNPADYRLYLDMDGICNCNTGADNYPDRELLLTYPDIFGVIDTCYGNHAKFRYTYTSVGHSPDEGDYTCESEGIGVCGQDYEPVQGHGGRTMYIDYRALCVICKGFWQDGTVMDMVRVLYPSDSEAAYWYQYTKRLIVPATSDAFSGRHGFYETAEFTGTYYTPFTDDTEIYHEQTCTDGSHYERHGLKFSGWNYSWYYSGFDADMYVNGCQPTEICGGQYRDRQEAEEDNGCHINVPTPCIGIGNTASHLYNKLPVLSPDFTVVDHPCSVREVVHEYTWGEGEDQYTFYETEWCTIKRWITIGVDTGSCNWLMLNVNYVRTNKGLLVKGLGGYVDSYVLLGAGNYPQYTYCWYPEPDEDTPHWNDETVVCTPHLDMLSCLGFDDWGIPEESDSSSDSSSSSESISDSESTSVSEGV